jgi:hypothetical protein
MASNDYTTLASVKAYGDSGSGTSKDALINNLITEYSRALDRYCSQSFYQQTITAAKYRAIVDKAGLLTFYPPVAQVNTVSTASWRFRGINSWNTLDPTVIDIANSDHGSVLRVYGLDFSSNRNTALEVQITCTAGVALNSLPEDLALTATRLAWWGFKKSSAPMEKTAMPEMGVLIIPTSWPSDIKQMLTPFRNLYPR